MTEGKTVLAPLFDIEGFVLMVLKEVSLAHEIIGPELVASHFADL